MRTDLRQKDEPGPILWDAFGLQTLHSGVGRHAWDLLQALAKAACLPRIIPSIPTIDAHFSDYLSPHKIGWPRSKIKPLSLVWTSRWLRSFLDKNREESFILHALSNYNLPTLRSQRLRRVLTVHDLIPILRKRDVSSALSLYLHYQLPRALAAADVIICVSGWTESTLHDLYPESRGRTMQIPNGWPRVQPVLGDIKARSLLTVSRFESYKRLSLIRDILNHLPKDIVWTVVTDRRGFELLHQASEPRLIIRTGLADQELSELHRHAGVYVHPSLLEGFCLPAAASISHGVPVLYTRGSGIDEVVGQAGLGLEASAGGQKWAAAIEQLLNDKSFRLHCRDRSDSAPGWDDVAASTLRLYGKLRER